MDGHHLAAGVVVIVDGSILLVQEDGQWRLPKGTPEAGEALRDTAVRETLEETGSTVTLGDIAFVTEYRSRRWGLYLQVYYEATIEAPTEAGRPAIDAAIGEVRLATPAELGSFITVPSLDRAPAALARAPRHPAPLFRSRCRETIRMSIARDAIRHRRPQTGARRRRPRRAPTPLAPAGFGTDRPSGWAPAAGPSTDGPPNRFLPHPSRRATPAGGLPPVVARPRMSGNRRRPTGH